MRPWFLSFCVCCFIDRDPRVRKIKNESSSCPGILSITVRFWYVAFQIPGVQVKRESPPGVVVEDLGIRTLHLGNLQCGRRRMTFMSGSGRSRNYSLYGEKKKPTGLYFLGVIMK